MKKVKSTHSNSFLEIIVPVKNEEKNVEELTKQIHEDLYEKNIQYSLTYIVDKSTDKTLEILQKLSTKYPLRFFEKKGIPGKAYSILEGLEYAQSEYVAFIDGDLQYSPKHLPDMLEKLIQNPTAGIVVAERTTYQTSALRKIGSKLNALIFGKYLLGLDCDIQSGLKVFRRDIASQINKSLVSPWTIDIPLLHEVNEQGYAILTHDIDFEMRREGVSKVSFIKTGIEIAKCAVKTKLTPSRVYEYENGFTYKKKRYNTHTKLAHNKTALVTFENKQKIAFSLILFMVVFGLVVKPWLTTVSIIGVLSTIYFLDVLFNLYVVLKSLHFPPELKVSDEKVAHLNDADLPVYTILCPLYKEASVLEDFITNVGKMDWPKEKLEVLLLLEEDDSETKQAADTMNLPSFVKVVVVPNSQPKTKPKACNYGLKIATGEYVVIYDAEDRPDYLQLKKAYSAFNEGDEKLFCVQAKLNYFNPLHNFINSIIYS